jgi:Zn finger protein HypA/HybF involved in hydrogenase expression
VASTVEATERAEIPKPLKVRCVACGNSIESGSTEFMLCAECRRIPNLFLG